MRLDLNSDLKISNSRYCTKCQSEIDPDSVLRSHGWCEHCHDTVNVTSCKVPYWAVAVTLTLSYVIPLMSSIT